MDILIFWILGLLTGVCSTMLYVESKEITPFEHSLEEYCIKVGSTLESYNLKGELTCENCAKFDYEITK